MNAGKRTFSQRATNTHRHTCSLGQTKRIGGFLHFIRQVAQSAFHLL